ncbi:zinc finger protein 90-like [Ixodes scapularis]|uniref:zinc finger protein 90-like n=1 Tax=Ixodes scapularis TaxID=6945 RepID=UPI001C38E4A8|nr:zinc finger protein 90-like [Ixodes scapularis]
MLFCFFSDEVWEVLFKKNFSNPAANQVQPEECDNQSCPIKKEQEETASNTKGEQFNFGGSWSTLPSWPVGASHGGVSQSQRGKHRCSFCTYSSDLISDITKHERKQTGEKPYVCRICHKAFVRSDSLADHLRIHTGGRRFRCQLCQKAFARSWSLAIHQEVHMEHKHLGCRFCSKAFALEVSLRDHEKMHLRGKPFECQTCKKSIPHRSNLVLHEKTHWG